MDEAETKTCPNCKREIPAVNFTIHTVHCARNIKICPVCKEVVPHAELVDHHEKLHKLLPCKKCGESVCGTDLEDHIRDSCAHTIKSCRFCELELPRRELPAHEAYCGVRTEQCAECREWVMIKYRQLHRDSNHGFLRLDDDPVPQPRREPAKTQKLPNSIEPPASSAAALIRALSGPSTSSTADTNGFVKNINLAQDRIWPELRPRPGPSVEPAASGSRAQDNQRLPLKRTNDQPQINTNVAATEKVNKDLGISRGAVKKRQAPKPPAAPPAPDPRRDLPYYRALQRQQDEERQRQEQTAINLACGLPPVLSPAAKLERLRKLDALHNRETSEPQPPPARDLRQEFRDIKPMNPEEFLRRFQSLQVALPEERSSRSNGETGSRSNGESTNNGNGASRSNGNSQGEDRSEANSGGGGDRFSEIKSSLMALRRGLNEVDELLNVQVDQLTDANIMCQVTRGVHWLLDWVGTWPSQQRLMVTAPYNSWTEGETNNSRARGRDASPSSESESHSNDDEDVRLPCEFCNRPILLDDLVVHQTGCRPDLAQLKPAAGAASHRQQRRRLRQKQRRHQLVQLRPPAPPAQAAHFPADLPPHPDDQPVIPCEFCTESLPVYLISDHQERCRREGPLMYPD